MNETTKEPNSEWKIYFCYGVHMLLTLVCAAGVAWFSNEVILEHAWNGYYFVFSGAILGVIVLYSLLEREKIYASVKTPGILLVCFLVSGLLLLLSDYYVNLPIWLIGGIVAAALVNRNIGMLYLYYFVFHAIYLQENWMNGLVFHFVVATLIAFFIPKMKTFFSMLYMMAFAACLIVTGSILHNQMYIDKGMMLDTFYILCTYQICIFITMLLVKWNGNQTEAMEKKEDNLVPGNYEYLELMAQHAANKDAEVETARLEAKKAEAEEAKVEETEVNASEEPVIEIDYSPYCDEKAPLLQELRIKDRSAYARAILVGKLASETAQCIGLNVQLTRAGGLYKMIGKIRENSNEYTTAEVAKEHNFPEPLIYLLDQLNHNIIEQKEAAVILMTDGVISYYSIVRASKKAEIAVEKIVDTIVSKKIFRGEFNESGLNMQECFVLREKLISLLKVQDMKHAAKSTERKTQE